jgi:uncharacterized caspase-like protein
MRSAPPRALAALALASVAAAAAGCATHHLVAWADDPRVRALPPLASAGEKVVLAPLEPIEPSERARTNAAIEASGAERWSPAPDEATLRGALAIGLRESGALGPLRATTATGTAALAEAFARGEDTLLRLRLRRYEVSFVGTNGWYVPNLFVWFMWWPVSWLVADETYALEAEVEVEAVDVRSERTIRRATLAARAERDLDDVDRGLVFLGLPYYPGGLKPDNYGKAAQVLAPFLERELALLLVAEARGPLREALAARRGERTGTTFAVTVGIPRYRSYAVHNLKYPAEDATAWRDALSGPRGPVPAKNHTLLLEEQATRAAVLAALREAAGRARPEDGLLFYFAGYGALLAPAAGDAPPEPCLVPYDAEPDDLARTGLPLEEVVRILAASGVSATAIVLDCGFAAPPGGRALDGPERTGEGRPLAIAAPEGAAAGPTPVAILAAAGAGEPALEVDDVRHGLFTQHLLVALRGEGRVTLADAFAVAAERAAAQAAIEGVRARPRAVGLAALERLGLAVGARP